MARYIGPVCKLCRREKTKLYLKGARCINKCTLDRRDTTPGQHGKRRVKLMGYALQLREKQKAKRIYGVLERQFRNYFEKANRMKGATGENLLILLERRLDNVIYQMGFAQSRRQARQFVRHNFFRINGRNVNVPSYLVAPGDVIEFRKDDRKKNVLVQSAVEMTKGRPLPDWLEVDFDKLIGKIKRLPTRADITVPVKEHLIVELYSK